MEIQKAKAILCLNQTPSRVLATFLDRNKLTIGSTLVDEQISLLMAKLYVEGYSFIAQAPDQEHYGKLTIFERDSILKFRAS